MRRALPIVLVLAACADRRPRDVPAPPAAPDAGPRGPAPVPVPRPAPIAEPPPLSDDELDTMMTDAVTFVTELAAAVEASGADCDALATRFARVMDDNRHFVEQARRYSHERDVDRRSREWMREHGEPLRVPLATIGPSGQRCLGNSRVMSVMETLGEL